MSTTDADVIAQVLAEVVANEDDPTWEAWTRYLHRIQAAAHDAEARAEQLRREVELGQLQRLADSAEERKDIAAQTPPTTWFNTKEAATAARVGRSTLQRAIAEERLHASNVGSALRPRWRVHLDDLNAWISEKAH